MDCAIWKTDVGWALKYRFALLIATARAGINAPSRFIVSVDGELNGASNAFFSRLVLEVWFERCFRLLDVGGCLFDFHHDFVRGVLCFHSFDFELSQRAGSPEGPPWGVARQIRVREQF